MSVLSRFYLCQQLYLLKNDQIYNLEKFYYRLET